MTGDFDSLWERIEQDFGRRAQSWQTPDCGLSAALRFSVQFADGTSAFVKAATDEQTEQWLRREYDVLRTLDIPFAPKVAAWLESPASRPILLTENLSGAYWPASHQGVTWRPGDFDIVLAGIEQISGTPVPAVLPALTNDADSAWAAVAGRTSELERLGLCSRAWFERSLPMLSEAAASVNLCGDQLLHGDLRSDNICLDGSRAIFVDWSNAARGNGDMNRASVLASLHLEGAPPPFDLFPAGGAWAARDAGILVRRILARGGMPRWLQYVLIQLAIINLDWAASSLGLPPRDGRPLIRAANPPS